MYFGAYCDRRRRRVYLRMHMTWQRINALKEFTVERLATSLRASADSRETSAAESDPWNALAFGVYECARFCCVARTTCILFKSILNVYTRKFDKRTHTCPWELCSPTIIKRSTPFQCMFEKFQRDKCFILEKCYSFDCDCLNMLKY